MEKVRPWCGQPSYRGWLKNRTGPWSWCPSTIITPLKVMCCFSQCQQNMLYFVTLGMIVQPRVNLCYFQFFYSVCFGCLLTANRTQVISHRRSRAGACLLLCTVSCCRTSSEGSSTNLRWLRCLQGAGKIAVSRWLHVFCLCYSC